MEHKEKTGKIYKTGSHLTCD